MLKWSTRFTRNAGNKMRIFRGRLHTLFKGGAAGATWIPAFAGMTDGGAGWFDRLTTLTTSGVPTTSGVLTTSGAGYSTAIMWCWTRLPRWTPIFITCRAGRSSGSGNIAVHAASIAGRSA